MYTAIIKIFRNNRYFFLFFFQQFVSVLEFSLGQRRKRVRFAKEMNMKFVISGILIACIGLLLSYTYRPYVYENHINDFHLADVIGSIVCVPAQVLCAYGIHGRYSIKQYTIWAAIAYIAYEFLGLFHIQGTFDVYDIIAIIISSLLFYGVCLWFGISRGR